MKNLAVTLSILCFAAAAHAQSDGPYVTRDPQQHWQALTVEATPDGTRAHAQPVEPGATLTIPAVGAVPAFSVKLRPPAQLAKDVITTRADAPLFIVADTHGEYEILVGMLQKHGVIDAQLKWHFGRGHLVVLGDVFDRGPNHLEILWLLYQLEAEARKAGGGAQLLLGNHEVMVMQGDLRYTHPRYLQSAQTLGVASYAELFGENSVLGQWLRTLPVVFKINDLLCLHAGISREVVDRNLTIAQINSVVREALASHPPALRDAALVQLLLTERGPLWYRGYFPDRGSAPATAEDVGLALTHFNVDRILVGHTTVPTITPLYDAKVIAVQVYPRHETSGAVTFESLLIRKGELLRARVDGSTEPLLQSH